MTGPLENSSPLRIAGEGTKAIPLRTSLTVDAIRGARCPAGKDRIWLYDTRVPGLAVMVTAGGSRAYYLYKWTGTRPVRLRLGGFPEISIDQARGLALEAHAKFAAVENPHADRKKIRQSTSLQELWDQWMEQHAKVRLKESTSRFDTYRFDICFADWKSRPIGDITASDVRALHARLGDKIGKTTANRAVQLLRRLFFWARIQPNPATRAVDFFRESERERFLRPEELPRFFKALRSAKTKDDLRDFVVLALFTGARRSNIEAMRWEEIDWTAATWLVPADKSKSGESMRIHLTRDALSALRKRKSQAKADSGWVFPCSRTQNHITIPWKDWQDLLQRAEIKDLRIHDLRRTLGSWQAATGASLPIIGKSLGHHDPAATKIYARLDIDPVRQSVDKAAAAIAAASKARKVGGK